MAKEGISGMKLAKRLGIPASTFKKIRSQEITNPTLATLVPIARYFSVSLEYFLQADDHFNNIENISKHPHDLPLLSWIEAIQFPNISPSHSCYVNAGHHYGAQVFALCIEAEHEALFPLGSFILVDSNVQPKHRDWVISINDNQSHAVLKQWVNQKEYRLLGVVIEYRRELFIKNLSTNKE